MPIAAEVRKVSQESFFYLRGIVARDEVTIVVRHRRHHPRSAIGRSSHHAAAGGILFVHRHRIHRDPVERRERIAQSFLQPLSP